MVIHRVPMHPDLPGKFRQFHIHRVPVHSQFAQECHSLYLSV